MRDSQSHAVASEANVTGATLYTHPSSVMPRKSSMHINTHGKGTVSHTTFSVDHTPRAIQKYTATHTTTRDSKISPWTLPRCVMPLDLFSISLLK